MKKAFGRTHLTSWLGPDAKALWATSFTMDEHEAFALAYRALGGRIPPGGVHMSFQRSGFRRAGQGAMPRSWLHPVDVPAEQPLPTYHPKVALSETSEGHALVVSTGNLTKDDLRNTRNLAVRLEVSARVASSVANWIRLRPTGHRALCIVVREGRVDVAKPKTNASSFAQFVRVLDRCPPCTRSGARSGLWVVAAPFWSPGALVRMFQCERDGSVEAYFQAEWLWQQIAATAQAASPAVALDRVAAYELRAADERPHWHHKIVGWRCCRRSSARAALYLGSANATICGFFGRHSGAINWEAGVIWLGGPELWDYARAVARAGYAASRRLVTPKDPADPTVTLEDDLGLVDTDERERLLAAHLARCIRINRRTREVRRVRAGAEVVRVLGRDWQLAKLRLRFEERADVRDGGLLVPGRKCCIPHGARAQVYAEYKSDPAAGQAPPSERPLSAETTIDLVELDPEPEHPPATRRTAIAAALAGLWSGRWSEDSGDGHGHSGTAPPGAQDDVRFPFADFFAMRSERPIGAGAWLDRICSDTEPALKPLPEHWRRIARMLRDAS